MVIWLKTYSQRFYFQISCYKIKSVNILISSPILPIVLLSLFSSCTSGASLFHLPTAEDALETSEVMVYVEGGSFPMGRNSGNGDENPVHSTTVLSFYISKYEVTQKLYRDVMGSSSSDTSGAIGDHYPLNKVSWYEAVVFCNQLSKRDGLSPAYTIRCSFSDYSYHSFSR